MKVGENLTTDLSFLFRSLEHADRKKGLYVGYTGYGNLGDEALRDAIFELFEDKILFSESRGMTVRIAEKIRLLRLDTLMLGGGTLLLWSREILEALTAPGFSHRIVFGTGVADPDFFKTVYDKELPVREWMKILGKVDFLGVRGPLSKQILEHHGIHNAEIIGDPVLYYARELRGKKTGRKKLGVNWGTSVDVWGNQLMWGQNESDFLDKFAGFLTCMADDGWDIEVLPVWDKDKEVIQHVLEKSKRQDKISVFENYHSVPDVLDRLETYDVFVGEKLHSVILASCANTPAVMVEYQPKCRDFMASIGREDFTVRTDQFEIRTVKGLVERLYQNLESLREQMNVRCLEYKQRLIDASKQAALNIYNETKHVSGGVS